jgi:RNase adaptor protein for sRNA GlmZ degradation
MNKRIVKLEDEQRNVLMPLVERCADVIDQNTLMMERLEKALDERFECPWRPKCSQQA